MKKFILFFCILCGIIATTDAKQYRVLHVEGEVGYTIKGKYNKIEKESTISDNWVLQMGKRSTIILMGRKEHTIYYTNNIKGKKLKDIIDDPQKVHFWEYSLFKIKELVRTIFHSDPEIKDGKVIRVNCNIIRGSNEEEGELNEYVQAFKDLLQKALDGETD